MCFESGKIVENEQNKTKSAKSHTVYVVLSLRYIVYQLALFF